MRKITTYLFLLILLPAISKKSYAQIFPNLGGQRAGISAFTFLKNDLSPRSLGMAGASVAMPGDGFAMAVNPAAATSIMHPTIALSSNSNATGVIQSFLGLSFPRKNAGVWMASLNYLSSGAQKRRTEFQPFGDGSYYRSDGFKAGIGYARALSKMFSCGMNLNFVNEQLAQYQSSALTADLGFLYHTDWKDLSFAVGFQHFGGNSTLKGSTLAVQYNRDPVSTEGYGSPTLFSMGVSMTAWKNERHKILTAAQLNHPNDNAENIRLGLHYSFDSLLHLRLGYKINVIGEGITAGAGIRSRIGAFPFTIEYAIVPNRFLGMQHSLGLILSIVNPGNRDENSEGVPFLRMKRRASERSARPEAPDSLAGKMAGFILNSPATLEIAKPGLVSESFMPNFPELSKAERPVRVKSIKTRPEKAKTRKQATTEKAKRTKQSGLKQRSIWEPPYLKTWTEPQWKIFLKEKEKGTLPKQQRR